MLYSVGSLSHGFQSKQKSAETENSLNEGEYSNTTLIQCVSACVKKHMSYYAHTQVAKNRDIVGLTLHSC